MNLPVYSCLKPWKRVKYQGLFDPKLPTSSLKDFYVYLGFFIPTCLLTFFLSHTTRYPYSSVIVGIGLSKTYTTIIVVVVIIVI